MIDLEYLTFSNIYTLSLIISIKEWYCGIEWLKKEHKKDSTYKQLNFDVLLLLYSFLWLVMSIPLALSILFYIPQYLYRIIKIQHYLQKRKKRQ